MPTESWCGTARRAVASRETFESQFSSLPGKVRQLLKHLDPRSHSQRNTERELQAMSQEERELLQRLLKYHQAFPLNHDYPKERHKSKYRGVARNQNHLISTDELRGFDKRG